MADGWLKLHRQSIESQYFSMGLKHIGMFKVLLLKANWKKGYFQGIDIEPGSFGTSISGLADLLSEDRRTVRKLLDDLESCGVITRQNVANRWTHITICNWATYQHLDDDVLPTNVPPTDQPSPDQLTIIEEGKKKRREEKNSAFNRFWKAYDYKKSKGQAEKAWNKIPQLLYGMIIDKAGQVRKSNPTKAYSQNPATWLNAKGWEDEIPTTGANGSQTTLTPAEPTEIQGYV